MEPNLDTGNKPVIKFGCSHCSSLFALENYFDRHACDPSMMPIKCDCGQESRNHMQFMEHFAQSHVGYESTQGNVCKICNVLCASEYDMRQHSSGHNQNHRPHGPRRMLLRDTSFYGSAMQQLAADATASAPNATLVAVQSIAVDNDVVECVPTSSYRLPIPPGTSGEFALDDDVVEVIQPIDGSVANQNIAKGRRRTKMRQSFEPRRNSSEIYLDDDDIEVIQPLDGSDANKNGVVAAGKRKTRRHKHTIQRQGNSLEIAVIDDDIEVIPQSHNQPHNNFAVDDDVMEVIEPLNDSVANQNGIISTGKKRRGQKEPQTGRSRKRICLTTKEGTPLVLTPVENTQSPSHPSPFTPLFLDPSTRAAFPTVPIEEAIHSLLPVAALATSQPVAFTPSTRRILAQIKKNLKGMGAVVGPTPKARAPRRNRAMAASSAAQLQIPSNLNAPPGTLAFLLADVVAPTPVEPPTVSSGPIPSAQPTPVMLPEEQPQGSVPPSLPSHPAPTGISPVAPQVIGTANEEPMVADLTPIPATPLTADSISTPASALLSVEQILRKRASTIRQALATPPAQEEPLDSAGLPTSDASSIPSLQLELPDGPIPATLEASAVPPTVETSPTTTSDLPSRLIPLAAIRNGKIPPPTVVLTPVKEPTRNAAGPISTPAILRVKQEPGSSTDQTRATPAQLATTPELPPVKQEPGIREYPTHSTPTTSPILSTAGVIISPSPAPLPVTQQPGTASGQARPTAATAATAAPLLTTPVLPESVKQETMRMAQHVLPIDKNTLTALFADFTKTDQFRGLLQQAARASAPRAKSHDVSSANAAGNEVTTEDETPSSSSNALPTSINENNADNQEQTEDHADLMDLGIDEGSVATGIELSTTVDNARDAPDVILIEEQAVSPTPSTHATTTPALTLETPPAQTILRYDQNTLTALLAQFVQANPQFGVILQSAASGVPAAVAAENTGCTAAAHLAETADAVMEADEVKENGVPCDSTAISETPRRLRSAAINNGKKDEVNVQSDQPLQNVASTDDDATKSERPRSLRSATRGRGTKEADRQSVQRTPATSQRKLRSASRIEESPKSSRQLRTPVPSSTTDNGSVAKSMRPKRTSSAAGNKEQKIINKKLRLASTQFSQSEPRPRQHKSTARGIVKMEEIEIIPIQRRSIPTRAVKSESRPSRINSEEGEEVQDEDEEFWSGKSGSNECPRCKQEVDGKDARRAHFKKFHYDVFYCLSTNMHDVERWLSCRVGAVEAGNTRDIRVCLHCKTDVQLFNGRVPLLKHLKEEHRDPFLELKTSYRLYSRTRRPEDIIVHRMLMRLLLALFVLVPVTDCKPHVLNSEHLPFFKMMLGTGVDMNVVNDVVKEKAMGLGITAQQHFHKCFIEDQKDGLKLQAFVEEAMEEFEKNSDRLHFDNVDMVLDVLKAESPKAHKAFVLIFNGILADLGKEAATFVLKLKHTLLETLVHHSKLSGKVHKLAKMYGAAIKKVYAGYDALSEEAKIDFEKKTCIFTTMDIIDRTGDHKGMFTELKEMFDVLLAIAK